MLKIRCNDENSKPEFEGISIHASLQLKCVLAFRNNNFSDIVFKFTSYY
jgi:hypothetical protein